MSTEPHPILVTVESIHDDLTVARGAVLDISPTGASLGTDRPLAVSSTVRVCLRYTAAHHEDELLGTVVTVEAAASDNGGYYARTVVRWLGPNEPVEPSLPPRDEA
jgi:hypothetical protein